MARPSRRQELCRLRRRLCSHSARRSQFVPSVIEAKLERLRRPCAPHRDTPARLPMKSRPGWLGSGFDAALRPRWIEITEKRRDTRRPGLNTSEGSIGDRDIACPKVTFPSELTWTSVAERRKTGMRTGGVSHENRHRRIPARDVPICRSRIVCTDADLIPVLP